VKKFLFLFFTCLLLVALILPACAAPKWENVIKVGVIGPMQFMEGEHHWMGAQMAAKEINDAGGINLNGKKYFVELVKADSNEILSPADAATAMEKLITVDKVDFVVGGFRTEAVFPMQEVAMDYKKIFIDCGAATMALCQKVADDYSRYKYFFRGTPINEVFLVTSDFKMLGMVAAMLKQELGITGNLKAAIIAEKLTWADPMVAIAQAQLPAMGLNVTGVWRPSDTATDVNAELTAIAATEPHIIFTTFSGPVGVTYAKQAGELQIPACSVGIVVEAQKKGFWQATGGKGNYILTLNTYAKGVAITDKSIPFFDKFEKATGEYPTYCAGTYDAILNMKRVIEEAQSLDPDVLVPFIEKTDFIGTGGRNVYYQMEGAEPPKVPHDLVYGPGYLTAIGTQWQDGKLNCVWPKKEYGRVDDYGNWGFEYPGTVPYTIPPNVIAKFKGQAPAAPSAAPTGGLSFEAAEYTNAELGFSVKYPKDWKQTPSEHLLFVAQSGGLVPALFVDAREAATFADALNASLEAAGGSGFKVVSEGETTLADGTKASKAVIKVKLKGLSGDGYAVGVKKGDKWITVMIGTASLLVRYDEAKFSEIAHTLQFTK
jgi:branched-chain amino acid transport system substrate-binding protein